MVFQELEDFVYHYLLDTGSPVMGANYLTLIVPPPPGEQHKISYPVMIEIFKSLKAQGLVVKDNSHGPYFSDYKAIQPTLPLE